MQGRVQAAIIAVLGLPILSQAAVALVFLRQGGNKGSLILLAGIAPAVVLFLAEMFTAMVALMAIAIFVVVVFGALVLRWSQSWAYALMALTAASVLVSLVIALVAPEDVSQFTSNMVETSKQIAKELAAAEGRSAEALSPAVEITNRYTLGALAMACLLSAVPSLVMARWWQAVLYNPGGFREEFHQLRLPPIMVVVSLLAGFYCYLSGGNNLMWAVVFFTPATVAGIAFVHWLAASRGIAAQWLAVFYVMLVFVAPLKSLLAIVAGLDSFLNLRGRLAPKP